MDTSGLKLLIGGGDGENCLVWVNTLFKPLPYRVISHPTFSSPFGHGFSNIFAANTNGQKNIISLIIGLFKNGRPPTVARLVIAQWVYTINGMFRAWAPTHICNKILELLPSVTKFDASSSVFRVRTISYELAATLNGGPNIVFGNFSKPVGFHPPACYFFAKATTGLSTQKISRSNFLSVAAITFTKPKTLFTFRVWMIRNSYEAAVPFTCSVYEITGMIHKRIIANLSKNRKAQLNAEASKMDWGRSLLVAQQLLGRANTKISAIQRKYLEGEKGVLASKNNFRGSNHA